MSQYFGEVTGKARTTATRLGSKNSGISGHIRGWDIGGKVIVEWNEERQEDVVTIYLTGGSNGGKSKCLGTFTRKDLE